MHENKSDFNHHQSATINHQAEFNNCALRSYWWITGISRVLKSRLEQFSQCWTVIIEQQLDWTWNWDHWKEQGRFQQLLEDDRWSCLQSGGAKPEQWEYPEESKRVTLHKSGKTVSKQKKEKWRKQQTAWKIRAGSQQQQQPTTVEHQWTQNSGLLV